MEYFGWFVLLIGALFMTRQSYGILMFSLGFTGRIAGEFFLFLAVTLFLFFLLWRFMPFSIVLN